MNMDVKAWLEGYSPQVLKSVIVFMQKECDIVYPIEHLETRPELAEYILNTMETQFEIDNATNAFIMLLGLYHWKNTCCPVYSKIYYETSMFDRFI